MTWHEGRGRESNPFDFRLLDPFGLGAPILEPDLDLGLGELELSGEFRPLRDGEVLLLAVFLFQCV